jgi:Fur family ferric uptake transcriptional regulator
MTSSEAKKKAKQILVDYLEVNDLRKTPERFAILDEIYSRKGHFDAEELFVEMKEKNYPISRATIYNTLEVLHKCELVKKHQFGHAQAVYEKSFGYQQHDHLICSECNKIVEFCDPRIHQINTMMGSLLNFKIDKHELTLYAHCLGGCEEKKKLEGKVKKGAV